MKAAEVLILVLCIAAAAMMAATAALMLRDAWGTFGPQGGRGNISDEFPDLGRIE